MMHKSLSRLIVVLLMCVCAYQVESSKSERAVPLCLPDERGDETLILQEEGLDVLGKIGDDPVVVISVTGQARTGKSYFLSQLSDNAEFDVGHGMDGKTAGIWISVNKEMIERDGVKARLVLIDTEGIGSITSEKKIVDKWDTSIVSLCTLISSVLIYSTQIPSLSDLQKLHFFSMFSDTMGMCSDDATLIWLIKSNTISLNDVGYDSWKLFFESRIFENTNEFVPNKIVAGIKKAFSNFDAIALPPPSTDPEICNKLNDEKVQEQIKPFLSEVKDAVIKVISKASIKHVFGEPMTGTKLQELIKTYVHKINSEGAKFPWNSAFESALRLRCERHFEECKKHFEDEIVQIDLAQQGVTFDSIVLEIDRIEEDTMSYFETFKIVSETLRYEYFEKLRTFVADERASISRKWAKLQFDKISQEHKSAIAKINLKRDDTKLREIIREIDGIEKATSNNFVKLKIDTADPAAGYWELVKSDMAKIKDETINSWLGYHFDLRSRIHTAEVQSIDLAQPEKEVIDKLTRIGQNTRSYFETDGSYDSSVLNEYSRKLGEHISRKYIDTIRNWREIHQWDTFKRYAMIAGSTAAGSVGGFMAGGPVGAAVGATVTLLGSYGVL